MATTRSKYFPIYGLAHAWADEGGEPKELVLRRLCHWAVAGAFPAGSFIKATGEAIDPFDLYMAFRAVTETSMFSGGIYLDGSTHYREFHWGAGLLSETLISADSIREFCHQMRVLPPSKLMNPFARNWYRTVKKYALSPRDCPDADERAAIVQAAQDAEASLNSLRAVLRGIRREGAGIPHYDQESVESLRKRWSDFSKSALRAISRSNNSSLQLVLDGLSIEWKEALPIAEEKEAAEAEKQLEDEVDEESHRLVPDAETRRGRPRGSGSYAELDAGIVTKMRADIEAKVFVSVTAAANHHANEARGGGSIESRSKRLGKRYAKAFPRG